MARRKDTPAAPEAVPLAPGPAAPEAASQPEGGPAPDDGTLAGEVPSSPAPSSEPGSDAAADDGAVEDATTAAAPGGTAAGLFDEPSLLVRGPAKGRRRAGLSFGPEPVAIPLSELTPEQQQAIRADPELLATDL